MVKKPRKTIDEEFVRLDVRVSPSDSDLLKMFSIAEHTDSNGVIKQALEALREKRAYTAKRSIERPFGPRQLDLILDDEASDEGRGRLTAGRSDVVTRKTRVIFFSELFITALEEASVYDPKRHHNAPPPALRLDDEGYLKEIQTLIGELKRLNENLESAAVAEKKPKAKRTSAPRKAAEKSIIQVSTHVNTFLNKYASALGTGAAVLTIGTAGALLHQLGVPFDTITKAFRR
jgi:hypothetical protein